VEAAGVHLVTARVVDLDLSQDRTHDSWTNRVRSLSIATGSMAFRRHSSSGDYALPLHPLENFVAGWRPSICMCCRRAAGQLVIIGGGAGGSEIALAVGRLRSVQMQCGSIS
jgi:NADH dehydrogenase FAD-containing subunit